jgi:hypothetical protein
MATAGAQCSAEPQKHQFRRGFAGDHGNRQLLPVGAQGVPVRHPGKTAENLLKLLILLRF